MVMCSEASRDLQHSRATCNYLFSVNALAQGSLVTKVVKHQTDTSSNLSAKCLYSPFYIRLEMLNAFLKVVAPFVCY